MQSTVEIVALLPWQQFLSYNPKTRCSCSLALLLGHLELYRFSARTAVGIIVHTLAVCFSLQPYSAVTASPEFLALYPCLVAPFVLPVVDTVGSRVKVHYRLSKSRHLNEIIHDRQDPPDWASM